MKRDYLHNGEYRLARELKKAAEELPEPNMGYILAYRGNLELRNRQPQTIARIVRELRYIFKFMPKDAKLAERADIEKIVIQLNKSGKAQISRKKIKQTLKAFYKWLLKSDIYPDIVRWIEMDKVSTMKLPEELLSENDIAKLIENCRNQRDKVIIALLFDTGMRVGELLNLKVKDVNLNKESQSYVIVDGKTGQRRATLVFSVPYLVNYLNDLKDSEPNRPLFLTSYKKPLDYSNVRKLLHDLKERAGIKKRLHAHLFRHTRASIYANSMTEQQLKKYFGWTGGSQMAATYVHLSGKDVDNAVLKANGILDETGEPVKPRLTIKACFKCHEKNEATAKYCTRCGSPLDLSPLEQIKKSSDVEEKLNNIVEALALLAERVNQQTKNDISEILEGT